MSTAEWAVHMYRLSHVFAYVFSGEDYVFTLEPNHLTDEVGHVLLRDLHVDQDIRSTRFCVDAREL